MLVTCPNCHRRGLIDADSPHDAPSRAVCPRCDVPFRAVPSRFESSAVVTAASAAKRAPAAVPSLFVTGREAAAHAAPRAFIAATARATTRDEDADVLALPRFEAPHASHGDGAGGVLDLGEGLFAREPRARPRAAADNYGRAVRLMNVSPLWLLAACAGFFALVFAFDLLLTPARRVDAEASALASLNNQASNRDTARRARAADVALSEESAAEEARTGYDEGPPPGAQADPVAPKPAPVSDAPRNSDAPRDEVNTRPGGGVSFENARAELRADAGGETQPSAITIQLGSFRVASEAQAQVDALRADGFDARVFEEQNSKRPWYRVQTGLFGAREDAVRHLAALRAKGFAADYTLREMRGEAGSR